MVPHSNTPAWKIHGRRRLVGCSPWGRKELDTTERLHFHFSLSCIGEGNGNPFQCSCLENPRDGGAWWAAVYGVAQSRTRMKRLSSSSSSSVKLQYWPPHEKSWLIGKDWDSLGNQGDQTNLKGNQPWIFTGKTDAEAPILWLLLLLSRVSRVQLYATP